MIKMIYVGATRLPLHFLAFFSAKGSQSWAYVTGEVSVHGVDSFPLSELQMTVESALRVQVIRFSARVTAVTQQTVMTLRFPE